MLPIYLYYYLRLIVCNDFLCYNTYIIKGCGLVIPLLFALGMIVLIVCLVGIFILTKNDVVTMLVYKTGMCESDIDERLKNKEDLILRCINIINRQVKLDIKIFEEVKNIKVSKLNNYDKDKLLSDAFKEIEKIYLDNSDLKKVKSFDGIIKDIEKIEIELISLRTLYNKWACEFNNLCVRFPYKMVCKIRKFKIKSLYEGKELKSDIEKEFNFMN